MSTRLTKTKTDKNSIPTGYEGNNIPDDIEVPACTIEDVDRALFNLFDNEVPLTYKTKEGVKRIPVIFATGERFAVLRRKKPLRDRNGALILPLVSIMRTAVSQEAQMGPGQGSPLTVKKRLSERDRGYQRIINKINLRSQDDVPTNDHRVYDENDVLQDTGAKPGQFATRRQSSKPSLDYRQGKLLSSKVEKNIIEVITIPPVKYYTSTYEITFWAQYTQQMNDMLMAMMSVYQNNHKRTFRLETDKGYWFVGYVGDSLSPGNNFDDFTDAERLVRYSFEVTVPGYVVGGDYPGAEPFLRKFVSAPEISFDATQVNAAPFGNPVGGVVSGDPFRHILQDVMTSNDALPGAGVATRGQINGGAQASSDARSLSSDVPSDNSTSIGGFSSGPENINLLRIVKDPFTGEQRQQLLKVKSRNQRKGETVYREQTTQELKFSD